MWEAIHWSVTGHIPWKVGKCHFLSCLLPWLWDIQKTTGGCSEQPQSMGLATGNFGGAGNLLEKVSQRPVPLATDDPMPAYYV